MRYVFGVVALTMLLFTVVQYNDPDGPLWMVYYGVPAVWAGITAPPHDVRLDNADEIKRHGCLIQIWAVQSRAMPPGNITEMTDQERSTLAAWRAQEAPSWLHCPSFLCGSNQP